MPVKLSNYGLCGKIPTDEIFNNSTFKYPVCGGPMIYTLTPSPSLDLVMKFSQDLIPGGAYRATEEELRPGGRGINISIMLKNLGIESTALGFVAGFSGDELMRLTSESGIKTGFIRVRRGRTRINLKLHDPKQETKLNGLGPVVTSKDIEYLKHRVASLNDGDFLVLAGNIPPSLPQDIYGVFCAAVASKDIKIVLDAPSPLWDGVLPFNPFLFKANLGELADHLHCTVAKLTPEIIRNKARILCKNGAKHVIISMGRDGALYSGQNDQQMHIIVPELPDVVDKTGAGDSMIAGFLSDYLKSRDILSAVKNAVAAGTATAGSAGLASASEVQTLRVRI